MELELALSLYSCGVGSIPGPGISACHGHSQEKEKEKENKLCVLKDWIWSNSTNYAKTKQYMKVGQNGGAGGHWTQPPPKNTTTCGTILRENQPENDRSILHNQSWRKDPHVLALAARLQASGFRLCSGLLHIFFRTKLKGHASQGMIFSLWYRKVKGLVKPRKHVWNLCSAISANIPLVRESHTTKTKGNRAAQFTLSF